MYDSMPPVYKVQLKSLENAINLCLEYINQEIYNEKLLNYLLNKASEKDEIQILKSIKQDMERHQTILKNFYLYFTGKNVSIEKVIEFYPPTNYIEGLKKAFFINQKNTELFTKLYILIQESVSNESFTSMAFEILQNTQKINSKYNFIINLNILKKFNNQ